jgi:RNA polymerase sigma-70 factor (ECF subfamily)
MGDEPFPVTPGPTHHPLMFGAGSTPVAPRPLTVAAPGFEQIYDEHVEFVWRSIRRLGVDDGAVDDVLQLVFLVVHRRLSEFAGASSVRTWLFGILLRVVREHRRTLQRKSPHLRHGTKSDDELVQLPDLSPGANPEQALSRAEAAETINKLLGFLDDEKRAVFVMAELEQMTAVEIGEALGIDAKAVYSRLRAARTDFERAAAAMRRRTLGRSP